MEVGKKGSEKNEVNEVRLKVVDRSGGEETDQQREEYKGTERKEENEEN